LEALCDFNGDGLLAVNLFQYRKRGEFKEVRKKEHQPLPADRKDRLKKDRQAQKDKEKEERAKGKDIENL